MPGRAPLPLDLTVLGQVRAASPDGGELLPVSGLGANLLVALALEPRGLSTARAIEETWPDAPPASGRAALQTLVSRLRGAHHAGLVASTAVGYALGVPPDRVDLGRAAAAAEEARGLLAAGDPAGAAGTAGAALELWDGEPGTGAPAAEAVAALRTRADATRRELLRVRAAALIDGDPSPGSSEAAVRAAEALVGLAPLDDTAHLLLLRALHAAGRTSEAVAAFARYREQLRDTLGTDPSAEVAAYHLALLSAAPPGTGTGPTGVRTAERPGPGATGPARSADGPPAGPAPGAAAAATRPGPSGLRVAPTALVGRDDDVRAVEELLGAAPVVTVLGTGGLGKTRLVQEVARRAAVRFPAVHVAELAGVRDDADVLPALAAALQLPDPTTRRGVTDVRSRPLAERVLDRLGEQPTLLVLDNCEHVLDGAATWVAEVVAALPSVQVLTTSRAPLGVHGERVHPLAPLPAREADGAPGPAVRLFTERATAVRPDVSLPPEVVERLCRRLDGLPLAIELAAARTRSLTVVEVERRLSDRFALLVTGAAGAPERHRTLRAVIAWSWDLLTERQRVLARRAAVLPDGFGVDAAVALAAGGAHETAVLDDLDALVSQSLLRVEEDARTGAVRYRMLETVREFCRREVLAVGEEALVRDLVLDWARDLAGRLVREAGSPERLLLHPLGEAEHDNLVAVLRRELAVGTERPDAVLPLYAVVALRWMAQGAHAEVKDVSAGALAASAGWRPEGEAEAAVLGLALLAGSELLFGDARAGVLARARLRRVAAGVGLRPPARLLVDVVERFHDRAAVAGVLAHARASDDLGARRLALLVSWSVAENDGDLEASVAYSREGYDLAVDTDDPWTRAMGAVTLAGGYAQLLRPQEALDWVAAARAALADPRVAHRDPLLTALSDGLEQSYAMTLLVLGEWDEAERAFEVVARSAVDVRDAELVSGLGIAEAWRGRGEVDRALARARAVIGRVGGLRPGDPWLLVATGICLAAHVLEGRAGHPALAELARRVAELEVTPTGFTDRPVLGTALLGVATWRVATDPGDPSGLELLAVAARIGSRQDFPAARVAPHRELAAATYGEAAVAAAWERAAALAHGADALRAVELLRTGAGAGAGR